MQRDLLHWLLCVLMESISLSIMESCAPFCRDSFTRNLALGLYGNSEILQIGEAAFPAKPGFSGMYAVV